MTKRKDARISELEARIECLETRLIESAKPNPLAHLKTNKKPRQLLVLVMVTIVMIAAAVSAAPAVKLDCPAGELFCFDANTPASATEVNHNFAQLKTWIVQKIGTVGDDNVDIDGVLSLNSNATTSTAPILSVDNNAWFRAKNSTGTYETFMHPRWSDDFLYLNYGSAGMKIRNNDSSPVMTFDPAGNINLVGNVQTTGIIDIGIIKQASCSGTNIQDCACPAGTKPIGGGVKCYNGGTALPLLNSVPTATGWHGVCSGNNQIEISVICANY